MRGNCSSPSPGPLPAVRGSGLGLGARHAAALAAAAAGSGRAGRSSQPADSAGLGGVSSPAGSSSGGSGPSGPSGVYKPPRRGKSKAAAKQSTEASSPAKAVFGTASLPASASIQLVDWGGYVDTEDAASDVDEFDQPEELDGYRGLVLDCSYRPINVVCWKRALCLEIADKADVLEYYDAVVRSTSQTFPIPAVLRVSHFVHTPKQSKRKLSLSRNNIFLRDKFQCQYCGSKENLTIDHVKALSRGGGSSWDNLVTACSPCNLKKGDKSPAEAGMKLSSKPKEPRELDCRDLPPNYKTFRSLARQRSTPSQWLDWLPVQQPNPF